MSINAISPVTGDVVSTHEEMTAAAVERIVDDVHRTFVEWRGTSFAARAAPLRKAGELLRAEANEFARLMAREMGKPVRDGVAETQKCALACDFFAEHAERLLARESIATDAHASFVTFSPLGVVLAVMPWNFPFWQVFRFAAPALMAGNAAVLKHASNVPGCALAIESVFRDAGFPRGLFSTVRVGSSAVAGLIADRRVVAATLTGS